MGYIKIYGSSDDLIEVEGDIEEEFSNSNFYQQKTFLVLSTGTVVAVSMTCDGGWRAVAENIAEGDHVREVVIDADCDDRGIEVDGEVLWVALVEKENIAFRTKPTRAGG